MKKYILGIIALVSLSCTKNDGDIGHLFGKWQLKSYTENENTITFDSLFMSFQGNVMDIRKLDPKTMFKPNYGLYENSGYYLFFYLSETDNSIDEFYLDLYKEFHFDSNKELVAIEKLSKKKMTLEKRGRKWYFEKF